MLITTCLCEHSVRVYLNSRNVANSPKLVILKTQKMWENCFCIRTFIGVCYVHIRMDGHGDRRKLQSIHGLWLKKN